MKILEHKGHEDIEEELKYEEDLKVFVTNRYDDEEIDIISTLNKTNQDVHKTPELLSFICRPKQGWGKFMPKKAIELGCKPGVHFRLLTEGKEVTLDNGTVIKPSEVLEVTPPSESFIVNYVPDESFVDSVISNKDYLPYFEANITEDTKLALIYHSVESINVLKNQQY